MTAFATLAGNGVTAATVQLPPSGVWWATAQLDAPVELTGRVDMVIAGLTLRGAIWQGGPYQGASSYRVVGGAGGWAKRLSAKGYWNPGGVALSTLLQDAAGGAGEQLAPGYTDRRVGTAWARAAGPGSRVLSLLLGRGWYVGEDGITRVGERAGGDVTAQYDVLPYHPGDRVAVIATETPEAIAIGSVLRAGMPRALRVHQVELVLSGAALRLHVAGQEVS